MADPTTVQEQRVITPGTSTDPGSVDSLPTTVLASGEVAVVVDMGGTAPDGKVQETPTAEDPMAAAVAANQATNQEDSPTEQKVIDATDEPQLTKEDQAALEKTQADNRALLQVEEKKTPAVITPKAITPAQKDWRVRMTLAPSANYLYNDAKDNPNHILYPLWSTKGVIFPYTPTIQTGYRANYEPAEITHTNYKSYFYKNSSVDDVTITADFTAQDSIEASYLLAVIHFFKSATKMFYGQDKNPRAGTPPPLVYLSGFGAYQFNNHPMVISSFTYALPNDVDYVRTSSSTTYSSDATNKNTASSGGSGGIMGFLKQTRLGSLLPGGKSKSNSPANAAAFNYLSSNEVTYVPSKIQITITGYPIVSRKDISNRFSVKDYASGKLTKGSTNGNSGIW